MPISLQPENNLRIVPSTMQRAPLCRAVSGVGFFSVTAILLPVGTSLPGNFGTDPVGAHAFMGAPSGIVHVAHAILTRPRKGSLSAMFDFEKIDEVIRKNRCLTTTTEMLDRPHTTDALTEKRRTASDDDHTIPEPIRNAGRS